MSEVDKLPNTCWKVMEGKSVEKGTGGILCLKNQTVISPVLML
jgi:hypothetical protein